MLLRQIKYFVTVVDTGSFTEAAEECFISQSAISQQILSLEKELGVQLLVRSTRRFTLTEPGKYLYSHGKKLLGETEKLKNGTIAAAAGQEGSLKVCYLNSFADARLYKAVSMFKQQNAGVRLNVSGGTHFKEMYVGKSLPTYDSMIVLTHFKGHASGGFGGSLKNIAIGCADAKVGKVMQHNADFSIRGAHFMEHMVEAGKAVTDFFGKRIAYVNVMRRMSVRCDCAGPDVEEPTIGDIGMVASTDLLAIDQACVDMVYDKPGGDNKDLIERIESREGLRQLSYMKELKMGNPNYELISID